MPPTPHPALTAEVWRTLRTEWLWVYRGRPTKVNEWSLEIPVPPGVFFVEEGLAKVRAAGREITIHPGNAFFTAPGVRQQWFKPGTLLLSAGFRSEWPDGTPLYRTGLNRLLRAPSLHRATKQLFKTIYGRQRMVSYLDAITVRPQDIQQWWRREAAFTSWFASYQETLTQHGVQPEPRASSAQRRVKEILDAVEAISFNTPSRTPPLRLSIGRRRAEQLLTAQTGLTLKAHLDRRRLREAKDALVASADSLKEIAHQLGFRHPSHFTLWFRRQTGLTPSAFRSGGGESAA